MAEAGHEQAALAVSADAPAQPTQAQACAAADGQQQPGKTALPSPADKQAVAAASPPRQLATQHSLGTSTCSTREDMRHNTLAPLFQATPAPLTGCSPATAVHAPNNGGNTPATADSLMVAGPAVGSAGSQLGRQTTTTPLLAHFKDSRELQLVAAAFAAGAAAGASAGQLTNGGLSLLEQFSSGDISGSSCHAAESAPTTSRMHAAAAASRAAVAAAAAAAAAAGAAGFPQLRSPPAVSQQRHQTKGRSSGAAANNNQKSQYRCVWQTFVACMPCCLPPLAKGLQACMLMQLALR